ncbi:hypothetical protein HHA01_02520 [Halomonas halmophila]|uniref:Uncharacterized protein n=1 Tax=Halomonas halmophila TaxID=252 RepID=A0A4Y4EY94_9GAMM|nr:hypothetical protein HHA01_02520 [Halomonas halmophila]
MHGTLGLLVEQFAGQGLDPDPGLSGLCQELREATGGIALLHPEFTRHFATRHQGSDGVHPMDGIQAARRPGPAAMGWLAHEESLASG